MNYTLGEVQGIDVYNNDAVVVREGYPVGNSDTVRGEIREFTWESRRRLAFVAQNTDVQFRTMITLTYPRDYPSNGKTVKAHLNRFLTWLRRDTGGCSYLWFLEFQKRGAPHFHILYDTAYAGGRDNAMGRLRFRVSAVWYRIVGRRDRRHLQAGTRCETIRKQDGARRYATKYAFKMKQKLVPADYRNVGRLWGASRDVKPQPLGFVRCTEDDIRGKLETWEHNPGIDRCLYRVLYNQAARFANHLPDKLDKTCQE